MKFAGTRYAAEDQFWLELQQHEERQVMRYVTSVERIGIRKGLQQGLQLGLQQGVQEGEIRALRRQLARRFGELPAWAEEQLRDTPLERLELWSERLLEAVSLEAVFSLKADH